MNDRDTRTMDKVDTTGTDLPREWDSRDSDRRTMDKVDASGTTINRERIGTTIDRTFDRNSDYDEYVEYDEHVSILSAGTLSGTPVTNLAGEDLGHVEDIMLDLASGNVAYVVVSFGGLLGIGSKLFALPWQALQIDQDRERVVIDVDKSTLENAPGFERDNWPQTAAPTWLGEVYTYYGYTYPLI